MTGRIITGADAASLATPSDTLYVGIGQLRETRDGLLAVAGLGSCVALGMMAPEAPWAAVVHIALPGGGPDLRYAEPAVAAVLAAARRNGIPRHRLAAWLVGGAHVIPILRQAIGDRNVASTREQLLTAGIRIVQEEVGGTRGRTAIFHAVHGTVDIHHVMPVDRSPPLRDA
jgi:chemotaxis protein CheD